MKVEKDYEEILKLFNSHRVKYCIIGAFAVAFYARPRYTKDIDILIDSSPENAERIIRALAEFGFEDLDLSEDDLCQEGNIIQLGYEPLRVDIVTSLSSISFNQVWKNKVSADYGREKVHFIGLDDLIQTKKQSSRPQDKVDLDLLVKAKKGK
jgi:hypothetical protein